ncbi:MAG: hypothetical protein A3H96_03570 [Acidobacteria bacterium RIFCSPLOWO2_02_FULL_67_36]|nr:MAG: hypothetical protein A3H96_03570 [Acidobacteria bacterium RIFCSPLOWO2_02_FULL_67_36]
MAQPPVQAARLIELEATAAAIRTEVLEVLASIGPDHRGHPGGTLSIVDIITALYFEVMNVDPLHPRWPDRDRFILSKGHGCLALYAALARRGFFGRRHLLTFRSVNSLLQGHPDMRRTPGVDMTTGSLGHGLSAGVGAALDLRARRSQAHVYVLLGDGELQEGLVWEGAMAAAKYRLRNLTAIIDRNGLQGSGRVEETMPLEPLGAKWKAFGWRVLEVDGHDIGQIVAALRRPHADGRPTVVVARTVKGKGVSHMEGDNRWHQGCPGAPLSDPPASEAVHVPITVSTRAAFGETLLDILRERADVMVVSADTRGSMHLDAVAREFPDRFIELGIAEQNLVTVAAGIAAGGRTVFAATYAVFASMRALEQVRTFVAYPRLPVVIAGALGGVSGGIEGVTHIAQEDLGILRCIPAMTIVTPADGVATRKAVRAAADRGGPVYIRLGRDECVPIFDESYPFGIGKGLVLKEDGYDAVLFTAGHIVAAVVEAAGSLADAGIGCTVIELATLKPLDRDLVMWAREKGRSFFTIEEHSIIGGLGTAIMEVFAETAPAVVNRIGLPDMFLESGSPSELRQKYGLTACQIAARVREVCDVCAPRAIRAARMT